MNHYTILMTGHNSIPWIEQSVMSALLQDYDNFDVIAMDAQTDDGTYEFLKEREMQHDNITVVRNEVRQYQPQNIYDGSRMAKDGSIIITLDFDDCLLHKNVLNTLNKYYTEDVWMTYGSYVKSSNGQITGFGRYSDDVISQNAFRKDQWRSTHLRTFRKELYFKIDDKDLKDENGEWFRVAGDLTFMWPMLEMCGDRFEFIPEPLYVYNEGNQNSVNRGDNAPEQLRNEKILRSKTPYERLESL